MEKNVTVVPYQGKMLPLFYHEYNCGLPEHPRTTERTIEIALADDWLSRCSGNVVEVGAVSPYYFPHRVPVVIDPYDSHLAVTERVSLFEYSFVGKHVLCISTLEHVGTCDYGNTKQHESSIAALNKILAESVSCFISVPLGYNALLDEYILSDRFGYTISVTYYYRGLLYNDWNMTFRPRQVSHIPYGPFSANALAIIEKVEK